MKCKKCNGIGIVEKDISIGEITPKNKVDLKWITIRCICPKCKGNGMIIICYRCKLEESFYSLRDALEAGWINIYGWMNMGRYITKVASGFSMCKDCSTVYEQNDAIEKEIG